MSVFRSGWRSLTHSSPRRAVALQLIRVTMSPNANGADVGELDSVAAAGATPPRPTYGLRLSRTEQRAQLLLPPREDPIGSSRMRGSVVS